MILFQTFDRAIVQQGDRVEFRKKTGALFVLIGIILVVAGLMAGAGHALRASESLAGVGLFLIGGAGLMLALAAVAALLSLALALSPRARLECCLDPGQGKVIRRRVEVPFASIETFRVVPLQRSWVSLVAALRGSDPLMLITAGPSQQAALEALAERFNQWLVKPAAGLSPAPALTLEVSKRMTRLSGLIALALGLLWAGGGHFVFSGLYFTSRRVPELRIPVWSVGMLISAIGIFWLLRSKGK